MNLLFLRGQIPQDRDPNQIVFDSIEECDDMWTQLAYAICNHNNGIGEVIYWGGKRNKKFKDNFSEKWVGNLNNYNPDFYPDIIFARGGFKEYNSILNRYPKSFKIYYGAGQRYYPQKGHFNNYNLILTDSENQLKDIKVRFPNIKSSVFIKPASENIFKPYDVKKEYDVVFVGNLHKRGIKGHDFLLPILNNNFKSLQIGINSKGLRLKYANVHFTGWIPRKDVAKNMCKAKIAVVACSNLMDSCPRVIPESFACGLPLVCLNETRFWQDKYINNKTGLIASRKNFAETIKNALNNYDKFNSYDYYMDNLSLKKSSEFICDIIKRGI